MVVDHRAIGVSANFGWNTFWLDLKIVDLDSKHKTQWTMFYAEKPRFGKSEPTRSCQFWSRFSSQCFVLATGSLAAINCCSQFFCHLGNQRGDRSEWQINEITDKVVPLPYHMALTTPGLCLYYVKILVVIQLV